MPFNGKCAIGVLQNQWLKIDHTQVTCKFLLVTAFLRVNYAMFEKDS